MRKTVLVRGYLNRNLGDDLFFKILFERYPNVNFVISDRKYVLNFIDKLKCNNVIRKNNKLNFLERVIVRFLDRNYSKRKFFWNIISSEKLYDAVLIIGGSLFQNPRKGVGSFFIDDATAIYKKIGNATPKYVIGSNFGPYVEDEFYRKAKDFFFSTSDVCFRDSYSWTLFKELPNVRYAPDVVFNLAYKSVEKIQNSIGISLINSSETFRRNLYPYQDDYLRAITRIVTQAAKDNRIVRLFSFCRSEGDDKAIQVVMSNIPKELHKMISLIYYEDDILSFLDSFQEMEIMICTRFHSMILGLLFKQKIFPIIYGKKMLHVLEDIGYKNKFINIEESKLLTYDDVVKNSLNDVTNIDEIREMAKRQFQELDKLLLK